MTDYSLLRRRMVRHQIEARGMSSPKVLGATDSVSRSGPLKPLQFNQIGSLEYLDGRPGNRRACPLPIRVPHAVAGRPGNL